MLTRLKRAMRRSTQVQELYHRVVTQSRLPVFYDKGGVPDTVDGRFELLALHMVAVLRVLKSRDPQVKRFAQELYDFMFYAMDVGLREASVGDGGVRQQIRRLTGSFSGRVVAYERALNQARSETGQRAETGQVAEAEKMTEKLDHVLRRNLFGTLDDADCDPSMTAAFAVYFVDVVSDLERQGQAAVLSANIVFPVFGGDGHDRE